ncbi:MAG TPA: response regulator transcription factor [Pyrinomonadaceae bacterium]|nr:response regulator transcription factor [Pyrinomonadaceae bacterium]
MTDDQPSIRIMLVDDHAVVRAGLRMLIESISNMSIVAMASSGAEALDLAVRETPDLILLDLDLGRENGLHLIPQLHEKQKDVRILVLTGLRDAEAHRNAIKAGAAGVVLKDEAAEVLIKAIERVNAGEVWMNRGIMSHLFQEMIRKGEAPDAEQSKIKNLTERELQVVKLIAEGLKNKEISKRLFISETTVTHHLTSIFSKLDVSDRLELVIYSFTHGLARMPISPQENLEA